MKLRPITLLVAVLLLVATFALTALASTGAITLDFRVVRGVPGSVHELYSGPMPVVGETCHVVASDAGNNTSVHPGNDLMLSTGGTAIIFADVERAPNVSTPGSGAIVPGEFGVVTLTLGPDGVYSADLILEFECQPITTTSTTGPTPEDTTTTSSTTLVPPSSSTTTPTTLPTSSTTSAPAPTTTAPTDCVDIPGEVICELPFTGPESHVMPLLAAGLLLAGIATLRYARRES